MVAAVSLPREPRHPVLVCMDEWWAQALLPARVVLDANSNMSLIALGQPRTISCMAYEWSLIRRFLWYRSQGTGHRFPHPAFLSSYVRQHSPCLFHPYRFRLSDLGEMAHGDDRGNCPCDESSRHGSELPPPCRIRSVAGANFMHALRR
jgi:hypothetical protein